MILYYNTDPNITPEERIQSLRDNVQLALDEQQMIIDNFSKSLLKAFGADVSKLRNDFTTFSEQMQAVTEALSGSITELVETVGNHTEDITSLKNRMTTAEGNITTNAGGISTNANNISALSDYYTALEARVRALEGNNNRASFSSINFVEADEAEKDGEDR